MQRKNIFVGFVGALFLIGGGYFLDIDTDNEKGVLNREAHQDGMVEDYEIYPTDVVRKIEQGDPIVLLDVRTPEEYEEIHLKSAILLPVQGLSAQSLAEIGLGDDAKDREIIIYCRSGSRSKTAYDIMKSLGYTNIKSVAGGMIHWEEDDFPFTEVGSYAGSNVIVADSSSEATEGARIELDRTFYDFGVVPQYGGVVQKEFTVRNTGNETLVIGDITTSCSCTSATISKNSIEPGDMAKLTVIFDPNFHEEPVDVFKRTVFIQTNDPETPEAEVVIQVDIAEGI